MKHQALPERTEDPSVPIGADTPMLFFVSGAAGIPLLASPRVLVADRAAAPCARRRRCQRHCQHLYQHPHQRVPQVPRCRGRAYAEPDREAEAGFKAANLVSLRAFGDLAFALVVYQAQLYATVYADLAADESMGIRPELLLVIGAVLGIWTVSETVASQISAAARRAADSTRQASDIAKDFTTFLFSVDSLLDASLPLGEPLDEVEADAFLSWMGEADDDMATGSKRGARTVQVLSDPAKSAAPVRKKLALRLGLLQPSGNEVDAVLRRMEKEDPDPDVSLAATNSLQNRSIAAAGPTSEEAEQIVLEQEGTTAAVVVGELTEKSMLRTIPKEELHLLCICAGLAVSIEIYESLYGSANDILHLVGLGWLLSVSGAAVYPNSTGSFKALTRDRLAAFRDKFRR